MTERKGCMVISLDFELFWGVMDHKTIDEYGENILGAKNAVQRILGVFNDYDIHATWGCVGMMALDSIQECIDCRPKTQPTYERATLSPYNALHSYIDDSEYFVASKIIERISMSKGQEIASHTYSHYYCMEKGQTKEQFRTDIEYSIKSLCKYGSISSIIFPRNQVNPQYRGVLKELGVKAYRGNENSIVYSDADSVIGNRMWKRMFRLIDSYINVLGNHCISYDKLKDEMGLLNIRSSRFLRPYSKKLFFLEKLKLLRIKGQMRYAAKNGEIFHIWWHPHNFGINTEKNMSNLLAILRCYKGLKEKYGMESLSMRELTEIVG